METLRKIDCYGQLILSSLSILSLPFLYGGGFLVGLFILGCWQLISAFLNTYSFIHKGYRDQILLYWIFCVADLALLFFPVWINELFDPDNNLIFWIALAGAVIIACYYWIIYSKLIGFISLKNELGGLLKSKN